MHSSQIVAFQQAIEHTLLPYLVVHSAHHREPVQLLSLPSPWLWVGSGNYAVVLAHPEFPSIVVKVYATINSGLADEVAVYQKIGEHPTFSRCYASGDRFLILKRLHGLTLYDCVIRGIRVERQVFQDVELALEYARQVGLYPHDVHGKNILMHEGRGYVVDVSDFNKLEVCTMWEDLRRAYDRFYVHTLYRYPIPIPNWLMDVIRKCYRWIRK